MIKNNEKIIDFNICVNNEFVFEECKWYINRLIVPNGYEISINPYRNASGITGAYNSLMRNSDSKYRVYMHQDTFILNVNFIKDILKVFSSDDAIGMIGVLGADRLPQDAMCFNSWNLGGTYASNIISTFRHPEHGNETLYKSDYVEADAIDGMIMITQYDLDWRDDLDLRWDFYDISQSLEFKRAGYKVVVPKQEGSFWCLHDCGISKMGGYDRAREIILKEYKDYLEGEYKESSYAELDNLNDGVFRIELSALEKGDLEKLISIDNEVYLNNNRKNSNITYMHIFIMILYAELGREDESFSFIGTNLTFDEMVNKFVNIKFRIRRGLLNSTVGYEKTILPNENVSTEAYKVIYNCATYL